MHKTKLEPIFLKALTMDNEDDVSLEEWEKYVELRDRKFLPNYGKQFEMEEKEAVDICYNQNITELYADDMYPPEKGCLQEIVEYILRLLKIK